MRSLWLAAAAVLCVLATGAAAPAAPIAPTASCTAVPSAYRGNSTKAGIWASSCIVCNRIGPRKLGQAAHLGSASPRTVARRYAENYVRLAQARPIVTRLGGKAAAKAIIQSGCYTGFQARGRP